MKYTAGIIPYRYKDDKLEIFLAHPGGPLWKNKDNWGIVKGEFDSSQEDAFHAALREFKEETGRDLSHLNPELFISLPRFKQSTEKTVTSWLVPYSFSPFGCHSNTFDMEWPPKSGRTESFPEMDDWRWFTLEEAKAKMFAGQVQVTTLIEEKLSSLSVVKEDK